MQSSPCRNIILCGYANQATSNRSIQIYNVLIQLSVGNACCQTDPQTSIVSQQSLFAMEDTVTADLKPCMSIISEEAMRETESSNSTVKMCHQSNYAQSYNHLHLLLNVSCPWTTYFLAWKPPRLDKTDQEGLFLPIYQLLTGHLL